MLDGLGILTCVELAVVFLRSTSCAFGLSLSVEYLSLILSSDLSLASSTVAFLEVGVGAGLNKLSTEATALLLDLLLDLLGPGELV
jgi:hypothetical protein